MASRACKSADVLVLREPDRPGLLLVDQVTSRRRRLTSRESDSWLAWRFDVEDEPLLRSLTSDGFARLDAPPDGLPTTPVDDVVPEIVLSDARWSDETPDLTVLFNTRSMWRLNPLLALSPYGSACWRWIREGRTIGRMRRRAADLFGRDEVVPFLRRLTALGFLRDIPALECSSSAPETITKEFPAPAVQHQIPHARVPWYCLWELLTVCDLRCEICYLPHFDDHGPTPEEALAISAKLVDAGIFYVTLLGGEVLLRPDLATIVAVLREAGVFVKVITNGRRLTIAAATELARAGLNQIEVSLDGLTPALHDRSRGPGAFEAATRALGNARRSGIPRVALVLTLRADNVHEIESLPRFLDEQSVRECYVNLFKKVGLHGGASDHRPPSGRAREEIRVRIERWREERPDLTIALGGHPECSCGRTSALVGSDGRLRPCPFVGTDPGSLRAATFEDLWSALAKRLPPEGPLGVCRQAPVPSQSRSG